MNGCKNKVISIGDSFMAFLESNKKKEFYNDIIRIINHYENGNVAYEKYKKNSKLHRLDGPAMLIYFKSSKIYKELYYKDDVLHRENGAAEIEYNEQGDIINKLYYLNGIKYNELEYLLNIESL